MYGWCGLGDVVVGRTLCASSGYPTGVTRGRASQSTLYPSLHGLQLNQSIISDVYFGRSSTPDRMVWSWTLCHASGGQEEGVSHPPPLASPLEEHTIKRSNPKEKVKKRRYRFSKIEIESMDMLGWKDVCRQVASFARTPAAAQRAYTGKLVVGETLKESEILLEQTKEAMELLGDIDFTGIYDVRAAMDAACRGVILHPLVIGAFATTIEAIQRLVKDLENERHEDTTSLQQIISKHRDTIMDIDLPESIRCKIHVQDGRIRDDASEKLKTVRREKRENFEQLTSTADVWSRRMHACGASERPQVVIRRGRRCIPIKSGRNGELPEGSVALGTSGSGSTMYMEPAPLIPLNNIELQLAEEEKNEEDRILENLSQMIRKHSGVLRQILACITKIDLACARAQHALWLEGSLPPRLQKTGHPIDCQSVMHPVLLEPYLSPLPAPKLPQKVAQRMTGDSIAGSALEGINLIPELWEREDVSNTAHSSKKVEITGEVTTSHHDVKESIQPIDITIPLGKTAVIITGPNTGGKTASLKTFGLISLMAKAGMCIPTSDPSSVPALCWFDKILVDVGDAQSLEQNLSTFSGHVKRIKSILRDTTSESLVLLDEVGSGTDPTEGAAFALAILDVLAHGGAAMTYATTHHAELKEVASHDTSFINANVEFNVKTLLPTYRIVWGQSGESHALAVAEGLGFDSRVIEDARMIAQNLKERSESQFLQVESLKESLPSQISLVTSRINASQRELREHKTALEDAQARVQDIEREIEQLSQGKAMDGAVFEKINGIVTDARTGALSVADASQALSVIAGSARSAAEATLADTFDSEKTDIKAEWIPSIGDQVAVLSMAGRIAIIESVNMQKKKASVRAGSMVIGDVSFRNLRRHDPPKKSSSKKEIAQAPLEVASATQQQAPGLPAIQTSQNTVDVRGESTDDAIGIVQDAIGTSRPGAVLFVVHGVGTGKVRAGVLSYLRKAPRVLKAEQHQGSAGGCTVVYVQ